MLDVEEGMAPWSVYCDGSAVPNPGRMGLGAVWTSPDGAHHLLSQATHSMGCNNEAELRAVIATLQTLHAQGAHRIRLHCDNSVVVTQLTQVNAKPIARLAPLFDQARALMAAFDAVELVWIPQHRNGEADAQARAALGMGARGVNAKAAKVKGRRATG